MEQKKQSKEPFKGIQPDMAPKQIQQHEWEDRTGKNWLFKCPHCKWIKITKPKSMPVLYTFSIGESTLEEPACITRYPEQIKKCPDCDKQYGPCECGKIL